MSSSPARSATTATSPTATAAPNTEGTSTTSTTDLPFTCGNGVVDPGEECDDGNNVDNDACTNVCTLGGMTSTTLLTTVSSSSSGTTDTSSSSDTGNPGTCGNGIVEFFEHCDDGNNVGGDGCDPNCMLE